MAEKYQYKTIVRKGVEYLVPTWITPGSRREWFWVRWQQLGLPLPKYVPEITVTKSDNGTGRIAFEDNGVRIEHAA